MGKLTKNQKLAAEKIEAGKAYSLKEAEKEKILAKTKSEVKSIDTESTIESSKKKLEFKKVEEAAKAEIKKQYDLNDLEVYEKMMNVAKDNPELAIQWKNIDKEIKIAQIQGESLTKMNLGQITISGSESSNVLGDFINKIIPAIVGSKGTQTIPLPTKSKSSKSKGTEVYEGMIIGECNRDNDLAVNVVKGKNLTNVRASGSDHTVVLKRPRPISLEYAIEYINSDELVEITPNFIRLRKRILNTEERKKYDSRKK